MTVADDVSGCEEPEQMNARRRRWRRRVVAASVAASVVMASTATASCDADLLGAIVDTCGEAMAASVVMARRATSDQSWPAPHPHFAPTESSPHGLHLVRSRPNWCEVGIGTSWGSARRDAAPRFPRAPDAPSTSDPGTSLSHGTRRTRSGPEPRTSPTHGHQTPTGQAHPSTSLTHGHQTPPIHARSGTFATHRHQTDPIPARFAYVIDPRAPCAPDPPQTPVRS